MKADETDTRNNPQSMVIPGVNVQKGIAMTGGAMPLYRQVLALFCKDAEERLPMLHAAPDVSALTAFVTQVHALKSASASLGAADISAEAARLEAAGKDGDLAFIGENLPGFAKRLAELVNGINIALEAVGMAEDGMAAGGSEDLYSMLRELKSALKTENDSAIDSILEELNEKVLDSKTKEALEQISEQALVSEFGKAVETISILLEGAK